MRYAVALAAMLLAGAAHAGDPAQYNLVQSPIPNGCAAITFDGSFVGCRDYSTETLCFKLNPGDAEFTCLPANDPRAVTEIKREDAILAATRSPSDQLKVQLDRIEQMLRAIRSAYTVRLENTTGTLAGCPKETKQ